MSASGPYSPYKAVHQRGSLDVLRRGGQPIPRQVQLVISDLCNQDCVECAYRLDGYSSNQMFNAIDPKTGVFTHNPNRMIPYAKVLEILDDCADMGVGAIQLTGGGEPTVHPRHTDIFQAVLDRRMALALVTNGVLIKPADLAPLLQAAWIRISFEAASPDTYARVRRSPAWHFNQVLVNVAALVEARGAASRPIIGIGFVVARENWSEILDAARLARSLGVDNIRISAAFTPDDFDYHRPHYEAAQALAVEAETFATERFRVFNLFGERIDDLIQHRPDYSFCAYQHMNTYIGGDLNSYRCCVQSYNAHGLLGSLKEQRFRDLWASREKRRRMDDFDARSCERCQFNNKNRFLNYCLEENPEHVDFV